jgi:hypothetical protein
MSSPTHLVSRSLLVAALGLVPMAAIGDQGATAPAPAASAPSAAPLGISAEAKAVVDRMTAYLGTLQSFSIDSEGSRDELTAGGYKLQHNEQARLVVQRPNRMRAEVSGDLRNRVFVYDGAKMVIYSPDDAVYARFDAPDTLAKLVDQVLETGIDLPLIDVLRQAAAGTLTEQVTHGLRVGDASIDGVPCDHLAFRQPGADWQLWVAKGAQPLPRKVVITTRDAGDPQFMATMDWNLKPKLDPATFVFTAPKGAKEIPFQKPAAVANAAQ